MTKLKITTEQASKRLDELLVGLYPELSRSYISKLIRDAKILVNDVRQKSGYKLKVNDHIEINFEISEITQIPEIDIPIIYEDNDCLVVDKPIGVLSHSKGAFNPEATVATFIKPKLKGLDGERGGIVHRLDRATSGVMICAKTPEALSWLQKQFSQRRVKKTYYALILGHLSPKAAVIDMPIERHPKLRKTFRTGQHGKTAITEYKVVQSSKNYDLVKLQPQTGRTHQLRVHLRQLSHPIIGDTLYDGKVADRLYLHAQSLEITLPDKQRKVFTSKIPAEFEKLIKADV